MELPEVEVRFGTAGPGWQSALTVEDTAVVAAAVIAADAG